MAESASPPDVAEWTQEWKNHVTRLCTVTDLTGAEEDYPLAIGETVLVSISAALTPLNISCGDGVYEVRIIFDPDSFAANSDFGIRLNHEDHVGEFTRADIRGATSFATDEVDMVDSATDNHFNTDNHFLIHILGTITIMGTISVAHGTVFGIDSAGVENISVVGTYRKNDTLHTSLGTIFLSEAATGVCYVTRRA